MYARSSFDPFEGKTEYRVEVLAPLKKPCKEEHDVPWRGRRTPLFCVSHGDAQVTQLHFRVGLKDTSEWEKIGGLHITKNHFFACKCSRPDAPYYQTCKSVYKPSSFIFDNLLSDSSLPNPLPIVHCSSSQTVLLL